MNKQILIIVSVAVVSFLLGALVSMGFTAIGIMSNPFDNRVNEIQTKIIRFGLPNEINVTSRNVTSTIFFPRWKDVATFVWTPSNPRNNSILSIYSYCEYRTDNPIPQAWDTTPPIDVFWWSLTMRVILDKRVSDYGVSGDYHKIQVSAINLTEWEQSLSNEWNMVAFTVQSSRFEANQTYYDGFWANPNQNNYTVTFQTLHEDRASSTTPTYVRDINIIMEVIDGNP